MISIIERRRYRQRSATTGGMNDVGITRGQRLLIEEYAIPKDTASIVGIVRSTPTVKAVDARAARDAELDRLHGYTN